MKSILISIKPKYVELIANGEKTIEVRKTRPKIETPFKCYIYATWNGNSKEILLKEGKHLFVADYRLQLQRASGKVIGEFTCDRIDQIEKRGINNNFDYCYLSLNEWGNDDIEIEITDIKKSCISKEELNSYGATSHCLYGWHISDLKVYDKPRELSEFKKYMDCKNYYDCCACHNWDRLNLKCIAMNNEITRPPQSWQFISLGE